MAVEIDKMVVHNFFKTLSTTLSIWKYQEDVLRFSAISKIDWVTALLVLGGNPVYTYIYLLFKFWDICTFITNIFQFTSISYRLQVRVNKFAKLSECMQNWKNWRMKTRQIHIFYSEHWTNKMVTKFSVFPRHSHSMETMQHNTNTNNGHSQSAFEEPYKRNFS